MAAQGLQRQPDESGDDHQRVLGEAERRRLQLAGRSPHHRQVHLVVEDQLDDGVAVVHEKLELDLRVLSPEEREKPGCEIFRRADHGDGDTARRKAAKRRERVLRIVQCAKHRLRMAEQLRSRSGERHPPADPLEERQTGELLQRLHLHRDGGLREAELIGGSREGAVPGDGCEDAKLADSGVAHAATIIRIAYAKIKLP